jgi:hypothetical protein
VARRYGIPPARLVELAPLLFLLTAEQSLASRRRRLKEMQDAYSARQALALQARHLPLQAAFDSLLNDIYAAEQSSVDQRDLFADMLPDDRRLTATQFYEDYEEDEHNPFVAFLRSIADELVASDARIEIDTVSHASIKYKLCREQALALTDGDEAMAEDILEGSLPLHELPSEFRRDEAKSGRIEWFRQKAVNPPDAVLPEDLL